MIVAASWEGKISIKKITFLVMLYFFHLKTFNKID